MKKIILLLTLFAFALPSLSQPQFVAPVKVTVNADYSITFVQDLDPNPIAPYNTILFNCYSGVPGSVMVVEKTLNTASIFNNQWIYTSDPCVLFDSVQYAANGIVTFTDPNVYQAGFCSTNLWRQPGMTFCGYGQATLLCNCGITGTPVPYNGACGPVISPSGGTSGGNNGNGNGGGKKR